MKGSVAMTQVQAIIIPYFAPRIEFQDLAGQYAVNSSMAYTISLKGHGSNCISHLKQEYSARSGPMSKSASPTIVRYRTAGRSISHRVNTTTARAFHTVATVFGKPSDYTVDINVLDQITKNYPDSHSFIVEDSA